MYCIKCGKDTVMDQVFCPDCQQEMERYPVNPNTPVVLPKRPQAPSVKKAPRKKIIPPEEQIANLKRRVRFLTILLLLLFALGSAMIYGTIRYFQKDRFLPGQNYTSIISKSSTVATTGSE